MVLYKDKELTQPFKIEDIGDTEAGEIKLIDAYLKNHTTFDIVRIEYETFDPHIEILGIPDQLDFHSSHIVTIKYSPSLLREKPLDTFITFKGKKRILPE